MIYRIERFTHIHADDPEREIEFGVILNCQFGTEQNIFDPNTRSEYVLIVGLTAKELRRNTMIYQLGEYSIYNQENSNQTPIYQLLETALLRQHLESSQIYLGSKYPE